MMVAGLTGNYGMGKSTVLRIFRDLGAVTIGADEIVDRLLRQAPVLEQIRKLLGYGVFSPDGTLDRTRVADEVFGDRDKRAALEGLLHPLVLEEIEKLLEELAGQGAEKIVVIEIPLLFEKAYSGRFQRTITVYTDEATALKRLEAKGIGKESARMRLDVQMPIEEKMRKSDFIINNNGTLEETERQVRAVFDLLVREGNGGNH